MFIPRYETEVLQEKLNQAIQNGIGSTILISGEPGIGKTTLIKNFMDNCDNTSEKNVLTAVGSCLDMDGVSRGFLPWREVLIELDADKAAGKDEEKKSNFKKIIKTVFDEAGSQWLEAIPVIGDISSAILETAKSIAKDEELDIETGDSKKLALKDRIRNIARECTGEWLNVIPVIGNLTAAIYKTTNAIQKSKQVTYSQNQQDFFVRVMSRFRELAETNPVVIYIDDLQWADISSMNLFFYLSKNLKDSPYPLVLIGSFRQQDVKDGRLNPISGKMDRHPWEEKFNNLKRYNAADLIEISYLSDEQVSIYIDFQFPQNMFSEDFKNQIIGLTRGNSLFIKVLLFNLEERKIIFRKGEKFYSKNNFDLSVLPQTLNGVIGERFQRLSKELKDFLQIAAVQGNDFSLEIIGSILKESNFKLLKKVQDLQMKYSLILRSETVYEKLTKIYNFSHNLVQKYIYYQTTQEFRIETHSQIVSTLKRYFQGDEIYRVAEQYSFHLGVANQIIDENGIMIFEKGNCSNEILKEHSELTKYLGEKYQKEYRNEEAIKKYLEVSEIAKILVDKKTEIYFKIKAVELYRLIGNFEKAISVSEKCLQESKELKLRNLEALSLNEIGIIATTQSDFKKAKKYFEMQLKISEDLDDKIGIGKAIGHIGLIFSDRGEFDKAINCFEKQLEISKELEDENGISKAIGHIGLIHSEKGEFEKAMKCVEQSLKIKEKLKDKLGISNVIGNMGNVFSDQGNFKRAMLCYKKQLKLKKELGDKRGISIAVGNMGLVYTDQGEFKKAIKSYEVQFAISNELGDKMGASIALGNLGVVSKSKGDLDKAIEYLENSLEICEKLGSKSLISPISENLGSTYRDKGNFSKALECFEKDLNVCKELEDKRGVSIALGNIGVILTEKGKYEKAMESYDKAIEISKDLELKIYFKQLTDKIELLVLQEKFEEAETLNQNSFKVSKEMDFKTFNFANRVLTEKINFRLNDKNSAIKKLKEIFEEIEDEEEIANLNYELWKMTSDKRFKTEALKLYQVLYSKISKSYFKKCIEELEKTKSMK
ncbi:MAG: hypothetical protein DWQ06_08505 [Calditrichaeota bacterium]|nr:MAG: hypothetical protein DWQ06_08505 [Calditrichota bacterium]